MATQRKPYEDTGVPASRTKGEIMELLAAHEIDQVTFSGSGERGHLAVKFVGSVRYRWRIPVPESRDASKEERRLWRQMYWTLKAQLEAVEAGLWRIEHAFMPMIVDPQTQATLGEAASVAIDAGHWAPMLALPAGRR